MTAELFRDDSYLKTAEAVVREVRGDGIVLDRTVFYPSGGGQPGDTGFLARADGTRVAIADTRKGEGGILHVPAPDQPILAVGDAVTRVKVGDHVGVGCMVDSCLTCAACKRGEEQMCSKQVATYNGKDFSGRAATGPGAPQHTLGGYSDKMVVHERFAIIIPKTYPLECAGPVMCAGVTLFDPLRRYGAGKGTRVAIVGVGGLGQMGIRIAKALGCVVTAITRTAGKADFARECGAARRACHAAMAAVASRCAPRSERARPS
jgi:hypothetical protein